MTSITRCDVEKRGVTQQEPGAKIIENDFCCRGTVTTKETSNFGEKTDKKCCKHPRHFSPHAVVATVGFYAAEYHSDGELLLYTARVIASHILLRRFFAIFISQRKQSFGATVVVLLFSV